MAQRQRRHSPLPDFLKDEGYTFSVVEKLAAELA